MTVPYLTSWFAASLLALGLSVAVAHGQSSINECEKIQAADAYNQCLAKFGPPQKTQNLQPERPGDVKGSSEEAAASAGHAHGPTQRAGRSRRGRGTAARRGSGGRKRLVIGIRRRR